MAPGKDLTTEWALLYMYEYMYAALKGKQVKINAIQKICKYIYVRIGTQILCVNLKHIATR